MILLDVTISDTGVVWLWIGGAFALLMIILLVYSKDKWVKKVFEFERLEKIKDREVNSLARIAFEQWKIVHEAEIRADAIKRSTAVHTGKVTEHFIPFMSGFGYNIKDVRFIGSPIDLIIFDGHNEGKDRIDIIIVEVKTGTSKLSSRQKKD